MDVFELLDADEGPSFGLYATRALAEAEIVRLALTGCGAAHMRIEAREVQPVLSDEAVQAFRDSQGPWEAQDRDVVDGLGRPSFRVSGAETSVEQDTMIAQAIVDLVNSAMHGQWS